MGVEVELLYQALGTPLGIAVTVSNVPKAQQRLHQERAKLQDPDLAVLQFRTSPFQPEGEVWIVKATPPKPPVEPQNAPV